MAGPTLLPSDYHYIRLSVSPPIPDALLLRKTLENAMVQSFGTSRASTYMDVLWLAEDGKQAVIRVGSGDAEAVCAAVVVLTSVRLSVVKDTQFLPALLTENES